MHARRHAGIVAAIAAALMLAVLVASAKIRADAGADAAVERGVHRAAASAVALAVAALAWMARRDAALRIAAFAAFGLMLALSVAGAAGGPAPPAALALFNQAGGLGLAALLAWLWARARWPGGKAQPVARAALVLGGLQCLYGAALAAFVAQPGPAAVLAHAALGLAAAAVLAGTRHPLGVLAALAAPALGVFALWPGAPGLAIVAHAASAAVVLSAAAALQGRSPCGAAGG